jgi:WD40 repeat protein
LSCSGDTTVRVHRAGDGGNTRNFGGAEKFMFAVAASDDGKLIAAAGQDGILRLWNGQNNQPLFTLEPPPEAKPSTEKQAAK